MKSAVAIGLLCVLGTLAPLAEAQFGTKDCNVDDFLASQKEFNKKLGFKEDDDWKKPTDLLKDIHEYYGKNPELGLVNVCNAYNAQLNYLNAKDINPAKCFDPIFMLKNDDIPDHAQFYAGLSGYLRFQCGAGFYPVAKKFACASEVFAQYGRSMLQWIENTLFETEVDRVNRCQHVKNNELYFYKPLYDKCADTEIAYFGCQSYNKFFSSVYAECNNECKLQTSKKQQ